MIYSLIGTLIIGGIIIIHIRNYLQDKLLKERQEINERRFENIENQLNKHFEFTDGFNLRLISQHKRIQNLEGAHDGPKQTDRDSHRN